MRLPIILSLLSTLFIAASSLAQDVAIDEKPEFKSILSIAGGGTSTTIGISYERLLNKRLSYELGIGLFVGGIGMNFYSFRPIDVKQFNPFWGVRSSYNLQGSGGARNINYLPLGVNYMGGKKLCLAIDLGPAYIIQLSPNGKIAPESSLDYPEHL